MTTPSLHHLTFSLPGADLLRLYRAFPRRYPYLLESVAHGTPQARYSILMGYPQQQLVLEDGRLSLDGEACSETDFLSELDRQWRRARLDTEATGLPFNGGWFLYLGYELAGQIEPGLNLPAAGDGLPTAFASRVPAAFVLDLERDELHLLSEREDLLAQMRDDLGVLDAPVETDERPLAIELAEEAPERHHRVVERSKRYIFDGDIFQANLSRLWQGRLQRDVDAGVLYERLRRHNPAPFAGMARYRGAEVISSSPERLVEVRGQRVQTRPIAGTRPRGDGEADHSLSVELLGHPKERAEHIMLIDLERNDLGRICVPGSVEVNELMVLESYAHVHHIVSNVRGRLSPGTTPGEVIRAVFPGGTITGCPKVRCMEIIAELEQAGRGAYTGSMGYLNHNGDMDLNILIRTLVKHGPELRLRAGGGIVADSQPEAELRETRAKARGLLRALGVEEDG
jgi:anthranilate synthase component 1